VSSVYNCTNLLSSFLDNRVFSLLAIALLATVLLVVHKTLPGNKSKYIGFMLVTAGGLANIWQWFRYGCVHDYLSFFGLFSFNIYDLLVTTGIIQLVYLIVFTKNGNNRATE
jgi:lipoprotein signal peptidase